MPDWDLRNLSRHFDSFCELLIIMPHAQDCTGTAGWDGRRSHNAHGAMFAVSSMSVSINFIDTPWHLDLYELMIKCRESCELRPIMALWSMACRHFEVPGPEKSHIEVFSVCFRTCAL